MILLNITLFLMLIVVIAIAVKIYQDIDTVIESTKYIKNKYENFEKSKNDYISQVNNLTKENTKLDTEIKKNKEFFDIEKSRLENEKKEAIGIIKEDYVNLQNNINSHLKEQREEFELKLTSLRKDLEEIQLENNSLKNILSFHNLRFVQNPYDFSSKIIVWKGKIGKGEDILKVLEEIEQYIIKEKIPDKQLEIINLKNRFTIIQRENAMGTKDDSVYQQHRSQILNAILSMIDELQERYC